MHIDPLVDQSFQFYPLYHAQSIAHLPPSTQPDEDMMSKKTIALVGGTGRLGTLISNTLLDKGDVQLRPFIRPGSCDKAAGFVRRGAQIVEGGIGEGRFDRHLVRSRRP
jgi:hypothetical protein